MLPKILRVDEVASLLQISEQSVRNAIKGGQLKAIKLGKCYRITEYDLETYLNRRATC